jgi:tape measure domain-containing protein
MSDIQFTISSDSQQAQRDLNKLNKSVQGLENTAKSTADSIASLAKSVAGVVAGFSFAAVVQKTSDSFVQLNSRLSLSIDNMGELIRVQQELVKISQSTRTSIESTTEVFSGLAKSLKKPSSEILKITDTIQKASIVSGGSADSIKAALTQLNQGLQSGTLRGEELNSVFEQTPRLARAIADGLGVSLGELRALAQEGKVTTEAIFDALSSQSKQISAEFEKVGLTVGQSLLKIKDIAGLTLGEIFTETGRTPGIARAISAAADIIAENRNAIVTSAIIISASIQNTIDTAADLGRSVAPLFAQLGIEIKRLIPVVSFLQLQLGANLNIAFLKLYTEESIRLKSVLTATAAVFRRTLQFFGVDYKSDFFDAISRIALSKSIPELQKNIANLVQVIKDPDLTSLQGWWKILSGDVEIGTALLDALNYREIVKFLMPFREFLASLGLLENKLIVIGNVRFDKIKAIGDYVSEIVRLFDRLGAVIFQKFIIAFQVATQAVGSYLIELGRSFGGVVGSISTTIGRFIFSLSGFSAYTEKFAVSVTNSLVLMVSSIGLLNINKFATGFQVSTKAVKNSVITLLDDTLRLFITFGIKFKDAVSSSFSSNLFSSLSSFYKSATEQVGKGNAALVRAAAGIGMRARHNLGIELQYAGYYEESVKRIDKYTKLLNNVYLNIRAFGIRVKAVFFDIYDKVVGRSYWPDMVEGILSWSNKLVSEGTKKIKAFSSAVLNLFSNLSRKDFSFGDLGGEITDTLSINSDSLEKAARVASTAVVGGIIASLVSPAALSTFVAVLGLNIAKNLGFALENGLSSVFNFSIIGEIGRNLGSTLATLLKSAVEEIPSIIGAIISFSSGFINEFLGDLGLIGNGVKGILNLLTLGETGILPLMIFGVVGFDQITKQISEVSKGLGGILSSSVTSKLTQESIIKRVFGDKVDVAFAVAGITALLSVFTKEVNFVQAAFVATPLLVTAILGRDVAGKILVDAVRSILLKITAMITAQTAGSSVLQNMFARLFDNSTVAGTILTNAKSTIAKLFTGIKRVTDEERKKSFLAGGLSLSDFIFGPKAGMKGGFSAADFSMSGAGMDKDMFSNFTKTAKESADKAASGTKTGDSLLKAIILGSKPDGITYSFGSYVNTASNIAKEAANDVSKNTILNSATGLNAASKIKAELDLFLEFVRNKFTGLAGLGATFGPTGAIGKILFGKAGTVIALSALITLFTTEAKAGVMDIAATVSNYALEGGLLGWFLLSNSSVRAGISKAFDFVLKQFGLLKDAALMGPSNKVSWLARLIPILTGTAAAATGVITLFGALIYTIGDGDTFTEKFSDGLRKTTNTLIEFTTGIKEAIPRAIQEFSQFEKFSKRATNISNNLKEINPELSTKFNNSSNQISLKYINPKDVGEFTSLSKAIEKSIGAAKEESKELGEVSEKTTKQIETLLNRYEKFSERVSKTQGQDIAFDARIATINFRAEPAKIEKSVARLTAEVIQIASSALTRIVLAPLDASYNVFAFALNKLFDTNIAYDFFTNFAQRMGLILSGDQTAAIFTDWSKRLTGSVRTDVSYLGQEIIDSAALIEFAFQEFEDIGKGDLLGDERKDLVASINKTAQARDEALKNLRNAEGFRGFFLSPEERAQQRADIQQAKEELEKAVKEYAEVATRARDVKVRNIEVTVFQKDIKTLTENLDALKISYDANGVFNVEDLPGIKDKVEKLKQLQAQLLKTKDATEASGINAAINNLKIAVSLQLEKSASSTIKYQIETALKTANISGVNWVDLLNLDERNFRGLFDRITNVGRLTKELEAAQINKDFNKASQLANTIRQETAGITYELNAARLASGSFADALLNISFSDLKTFSNVYTAPIKEQEKLTKLIKEANLLSLQAKQIEGSAIGGRAGIGEIDRYKKQLATRGKAVTEEIDKIREGFTPKKKEKEKTALENLEEQLNKSNVKSKIDDVIKSKVPLTEVINDLTKIGITIGKINNLPKSKTGLPLDLVKAGEFKETLDKQIKEFDDKVSPKTLNNTFTELFKFSPDLLDKSFGELSKETVDKITAISKDIETALDQKYDPSKSLLANLLEFSKNKATIKAKADEASKLLGLSLKDALASLNIDLTEYLTYDVKTRENILSLTKKIIDEEEKIKDLQTKGATQANLDERARAEERKKNLEKQRKELLTANTLGKQAALLGLDLTVILGLDEAKKNKLIKDRIELDKLNEKISNNQLLEGETLQGLIARRAVLIEQEKQITDERSRQQSLQQAFLGQGKTLISDILKGKDNAGKAFFDAFSNTVVDNFSNQLGDFLFKDISKTLGDTLGADIFGTVGSSPLKPMYVSVVAGVKDALNGGGMLSGMWDKLKGFGNGIGDFFSKGFSSLGSIFSALPGFASGGVIPGNMGSATPVLAHAGEIVLNEAQQARIASAMSNQNQQVINVNITGDISRQTKSEIYRMLPSIAEGVNSHNREKGLR